MSIGKNDNVCPAVDGAISWNNGSYSPDTGLYYKAGQEWCQNMEAQHLPKPADFSGQMYMSATYDRVVTQFISGLKRFADRRYFAGSKRF